MKKFYKYKFDTNYLNVNLAGNLNVKPVLEYCQQATVMHGCEVGLAPEVMAAHKKFWVVSKIKLNFLKPIKINSNVELVSYMLKPTGSFTLEREFKFNVKNTPYIEGTSKWCLIDTEKQTLAHLDTIKDIFPTKFPKVKKLNLQYAKIVFDNNFKLNHTRKVMFNDLDINRHCNNQKYVEMAINCIPLEFIEKNVKSFDINYVKQCHYGDTINVYSKLEQNELSIVGKVNDEIVFTSKIEFDN